LKDPAIQEVFVTKRNRTGILIFFGSSSFYRDVQVRQERVLASVTMQRHVAPLLAARVVSSSSAALFFLEKLKVFAAQSKPQKRIPARRRSPAFQQGVYLVFPFENAGSSPRFDWLSEGSKN